MVNARPGYWDVDRCRWVGVEPADVLPPAVVHTPAASRDLRPGSAEPRMPAPRGRAQSETSEPSAG